MRTHAHSDKIIGLSVESIAFCFINNADRAQQPAIFLATVSTLTVIIILPVMVGLWS